jgi:hypothetical protein
MDKKNKCECGAEGCEIGHQLERAGIEVVEGAPADEFARVWQEGEQ